MQNRTTITQRTEQKQTTTTSAVQVMLSTIMEMPLADFEEHVKNEVDSNEALEIQPDENEWSNDSIPDELDYGRNDEFGVRSSNTSEEDYDAYLTIDEIPEDRRERYNSEMSIRNGNRNQFDGDSERQIADTGATSYDDVMAQIGELDLTPDEVSVMNYLVGSLDARGYLEKDNTTLLDELNFQEYLEIEPEHLERLIEMLQSFEPRGIGARNLQECMLLQMQCDPAEKPRLPLVKRLAHKVVRDMFEELSRSRWDKIQDALDVDDETIEEIKHTIHHLNPYPGSGLNESIQAVAPTVIPDFFVYVDENGKPIVVQSKGNIPELRVSSSFSDIVETFKKAQEEGNEGKLSRSQQDSYQYAKEKVESAQAFIESIRRRKVTLQKVMEGIVKRQIDFFTNEDDELLIKPMILRDIADYAEVDISTVSRAANSKFVRTDFGSYPLKFFFNSEFTNADGDSISQRNALAAIKEIIENEDKRHPLSDQQIKDYLERKGQNIARRTVAKYRDRLGFPTQNLRKVR